MFTMAIGLKGQAKPERWAPTKAVRLAALLSSLIFTSVAVNALIAVADSNLRAQSSPNKDCALIGEKAGRPACYDKLTNRPALHPFRGANAPAFNASL